MNLKRTALVLLFFVFSIASANAQQNYRWLYVTWETVSDLMNLIRSGTTPEVMRGFEFRLSNPVSITSVQNNDSRRNSITGVDGAGVPVLGGGQNTSSGLIQFTTEHRGSLNNISSELVINFKLESAEIPLRFRRNQYGYYELFSADIGVETNSLRSEGGPVLLQLLIKDDNSPVEYEAVPNSMPGGSQRRNDSFQQTADNRGQSYPQNISYSNNRSRQIMDRGSLAKETVIAYIRSRSQSPLAEQLVNIYFDEAYYEGVNPDIAIAQMLYATNFLSNQRMATRNYAGLGTNGTSWNGSFSTMTIGVRAHIQHLKSYARPPVRRDRNVDPRYPILARLNFLGTVSTFDQLYVKWSPYNSVDYKNRIDGILDSLYRFSGY
jgi:hypothetical protein